MQTVSMGKRVSRLLLGAVGVESSAPQARRCGWTAVAVVATAAAALVAHGLLARDGGPARSPQEPVAPRAAPTESSSGGLLWEMAQRKLGAPTPPAANATQGWSVVGLIVDGTQRTVVVRDPVGRNFLLTGNEPIDAGGLELQLVDLGSETVTLRVDGDTGSFPIP